MSKIKVLIMLPHLHTGGGQQLAIDEAIGLHRDGRFNVVLACMYKREETILATKAEKAGVRLHYFGKNEGFSLSYIRKVTKYISREKPDVVNTHLLALPYTIEAALRYKNVSFFHTIHSIAKEEADGKMGMVERFAYRFTSFCPIAISDYCRDTVSDYYGISKNRVAVIYNGIDLDRFNCTVEYSKRNNNMIRIISTGRMQPVKRHLLMIDAFKEVHDRFPNTELVLLGDGELRPTIEDSINQLNLTDSVMIKGVVNNVEEELNLAHIYLLTSDFEGLPLSVLEAMASGLPIVATKAGGTVDIVNDDNGILCDVGNKKQIVDALEYLIVNENERKNMSKKSIIKSRKYGLETCSKKYGKLFIKAVKKRKGH